MMRTSILHSKCEAAFENYTKYSYLHISLWHSLYYNYIVNISYMSRYNENSQKRTKVLEGENITVQVVYRVKWFKGFTCTHPLSYIIMQRLLLKET